MHFNDLLADLTSEVARVAEFLGIAVSEAEVDEIADATTFNTMKANADRLLPGAQRADVFLNEGTNNRWVGLLTQADLVLYKEACQRAVRTGDDEDCLDWLERDPG